jgi:hypothetical protein
MEYWNAGSKLKKLKRFVSLVKRFEDANNFNVFWNYYQDVICTQRA